MKKVSIVLIISIIFNFIICNFTYANNTSNASSGTFNMSSIYQADQEGTVEIEGHTKEIKVTQSAVGAVIGVIISPIVGVAATGSAIVSTIAISSGYYHTDSDFGIDKDGILKVSSILFGEVLLFDVSITRTGKALNPAITQTQIGELLDTIKESCIALFEILRAISIGAFLILILVSVIRLSVSTTATDRAKFKALILDWFIGLLFTFFVKYIVLLLNSILDVVMDSLWETRLALENSNNISFEFSFYTDIWKIIEQSGGMQFCAYGVLYIFLMWVTLKFTLKYLLRLLKILFMAVISPLVGAIYTFQRAGEKNGSTAIYEWITSYATNLFIQPIHAIIYLIFMFTASEIAINAPFLGVIFLWALERAEKIVRAILGLKDKAYIIGK